MCDANITNIFKYLNIGDVKKVEELISSYLYKNGSIYPEYRYDILHHALYADDYDMFEMLSKYIDVDVISPKIQSTLLIAVCYDIHANYKNEKTYLRMNILLKYTKNINIVLPNNYGAFNILVKSICFEYINLNNSLNHIILTMLNMGVDIFSTNFPNNSPIIDCIKYAHYDLLKFLLKHSNIHIVPIDILTYTLSHYYRDNLYDFIELLLPYISDINKPIKPNTTILKWYSKANYQNSDIIELLVENGACL